MGTPVDTDETTFPGRLRATLRARRMSQRQLADALGLEAATAVSHWATGKRMPNDLNLDQIARALDVDAEWLRGEPANTVADRLRQADLTSISPKPRVRRLARIFADEVAEHVDGLDQEQAEAYVRLSTFVLEATAMSSRYGWEITMHADLGDGRVISVDTANRTAELPEPPGGSMSPDELEQELEDEVRRAEGRDAAAGAAKPGRRRRAQGS